MKRNKGITLIALVITIIVLLILAGITINMLFGENGILNQAKRAKEQQKIAEEKDQIALAWNAAYLENQSANIKAADMNKQLIANGTNASAEDVGTNVIKVTFSETGHVYNIDTQGNITGPESTDSGGTDSGSKSEEEQLIEDIANKIKEEKDKNGTVTQENVDTIVNDNADKIQEAVKQGEKTIITTSTEKVYEVDDDGTYKELTGSEIAQDPNPGVLDGDGTEANPYKIQCIEDLVAFSLSVNSGEKTYEGKTVALERNLYFDGTLNSYAEPEAKYAVKNNSDNKPIGYEKNESSTKTLKTLLTEETGFSPVGLDGSGNFRGTFDGKNHYLAGILIKSHFGTSSAMSSALFGSNLTSSITIKNLGIESGNIGDQESWSAAGIVAYVSYIDSSSGYPDITISNCYNKAAITGENVAGIAAYLYTNNLEITNCYNQGTIVSSTHYAGGILAVNVADTSKDGTVIKVTKCYNKGDISIVDEVSSVGGIIGELNSGTSTEITECYNSGNISKSSTETGDYQVTAGVVGKLIGEGKIHVANCYNLGNITDQNQRGVISGVIGISQSGTGEEKIENCYNKGTITGSSQFASGIIGQTYKKDIIIGCYNQGDIAVTGESVGGIFGFGYATKIENCYNTAKIGTETARGTNTGGIVGNILGTSALLKGCYNTGVIIGGSNTGAIAGNGSGGCSSIVDCYNIANITGGGYTGGIAGGKNLTNSYINCYNTGDITSDGFAGGILGDMAVTSINFTNCYNKGKINAPNAGGILTGNASGSTITITNCYNLGEVKGQAPIGGILGNCDSSSNSTATITNCYNSGEIKGDGAPAGGIAGTGNITISNCHNTGNITGATGNTYLGEIILAGQPTTNCTYLKKESNAGANGATPKDDMTETMSITNFVNLMNTKVTENNGVEGNVKLNRWKVENGLPVFDI